MKQSGNHEIIPYFVLAFLLAWGAEAIIFAGERSGLLTGTVGYVLTFLLIGFGAGFAPAYAAVILLYRQKAITGIGSLFRLIIRTPNRKKTVWITAIFFLSQLLVNGISENYLGKPWYYFILLIPLMIVGGGVEEIGWRGFLLPRMERKYPFFVSAFIIGVLWGCWHLPLWLIRTASQSGMNILSFLCYCITFSFVLGLLYRLTKSIFACIMLHAWGNVLQDMFTRSALTDPVSIKMAVIWGVEILIAIIVSFLTDALEKPTSGNG